MLLLVYRSSELSMSSSPLDVGIFLDEFYFVLCAILGLIVKCIKAAMSEISCKIGPSTFFFLVLKLLSLSSRVVDLLDQRTILFLSFLHFFFKFEVGSSFTKLVGPFIYALYFIFYLPPLYCNFLLRNLSFPG